MTRAVAERAQPGVTTDCDDDLGVIGDRFRQDLQIVHGTDQHPGRSIAHEVIEQTAAHFSVEWYVDRPRRVGAQPSPHGLRTVVAHHADPVARLDTQATEAPSRRFYPVERFLARES